MIYLILISSAIAKAMCDRKAFKQGGVESSNGRGWLIKAPLSFLLGKWHFWDTVRVMSLCVAITMLGGFDVYMAVIFYIIHGIIFELIYNIKS